jgi:hypothetical protein
MREVPWGCAQKTPRHREEGRNSEKRPALNLAKGAYLKILQQIDVEKSNRKPIVEFLSRSGL